MFYYFLNFQYISEVKIDDIVYESLVNNQPTEYSNIKLYCGMSSDPFAPFTPFDGLLKNFKIEFSDNDQTENVVKLGNDYFQTVSKHLKILLKWMKMLKLIKIFANN